MKICVLVKEVPDAAVEKRIDPSTGRLNRSGEKNLNPFDTHAIEAAMQLKEGGPAPRGQRAGLDPPVTRDAGRDRHRELDVARLARVAHREIADEQRPRGLDAVLAEPPEQLREPAVGRAPELRLRRHVRRDREVGPCFSQLEPRLVFAHAG